VARNEGQHPLAVLGHSIRNGDPLVHGGYFPWNLGFRFSRKDCTPSA
jgi:hypothetical protein